MSRRVAREGLLVAVALLLGWVERLLPPLMATIPGAKLGLANLATLLTLILLGPWAALRVAGARILLYTAFILQLPVVYEDDNILLINKPAGISAADDGRGGMTALSLLTERAAGQYLPRLCHRHRLQQKRRPYPLRHPYL